MEVPARSSTTPSARLGRQPALDGLRAISVTAVLLYHAGFGFMTGGFFGVEVFFVVSGFLITSLLIEERVQTGAINVVKFWGRRARRLLPALFTMLIVVGIYVALRGSAEQASDLRDTYPWAIFYVANWGQIVRGVPYFSATTPSAFRHLWSLAVEEQWYLLWPIAAMGLLRIRTSDRTRGVFAIEASVVVMIFTAWFAYRSGFSSSNANFLYLSTITRSSGLLLGAGLAFIRRTVPAPTKKAARRSIGALDAVCVAAGAFLVWAFITGNASTRQTYGWILPMVSISSAAMIALVVGGRAPLVRELLSARWLVALGQRSYGIYLWSWPISVFMGAYTGSWAKFVGAMVVTAGASEICYRFVELPIRHGAFSRWRRRAAYAMNVRFAGLTSALVVVLIVGWLAAFYFDVKPFDQAAGGAAAAFVTPTTTAPTPTSGAQTSSTAPGTTVATVTTAPPVTAPLPRRLVIVGDSEAHALAINLPTGIQSTFTITDGSIEGCSVYDNGTVLTARPGYSWGFSGCAGWAQKWHNAAQRSSAQLALVVLGAWDVFDQEVNGTRFVFGTAPDDQRFLTQLQSGIDALKSAGSHVALLQVACMRPVDVKGEGTPPLPERGDDARVAHQNALLQRAAAADPKHVWFITGPPQWCNDPAIATNLAYRWDGVHVYKPGANLIYETIANSLLALPVS